MTTEYVSLALLSLLCTYFSKKETTIPTSILHSLSTFLSRRYNLNSTPSNRDRESLARDEPTVSNTSLQLPPPLHNHTSSRWLITLPP
mmetsp:Transcript_18340/g.28215  ORF Transcript_18340/g.28215 Transcript_18340/m.28215 type:complete len:88 (-) Transcript_18340:55-318(-)